MIMKPYKYAPNSLFTSIYWIINYLNLLNISTSIPIACLKAKVVIFQNWKKLPTYMKKSTSVRNQTWDFLYYTQHVYNPSKNPAYGKLVGCLTYHKQITIWHLCKQQTTPWNAFPLSFSCPLLSNVHVMFKGLSNITTQTCCPLMWPQKTKQTS